jgi:hypothetical protein
MRGGVRQPHRLIHPMPFSIRQRSEFFDIDLNLAGRGSCVICEDCRAAWALHFGSANGLDMSSLDADLQSVHVAWGGLPAAIRKAIAVLVETQK